MDQSRFLYLKFVFNSYFSPISCVKWHCVKTETTFSISESDTKINQLCTWYACSWWQKFIIYYYHNIHSSHNNFGEPTRLQNPAVLYVMYNIFKTTNMIFIQISQQSLLDNHDSKPQRKMTIKINSIAKRNSFLHLSLLLHLTYFSIYNWKS